MKNFDASRNKALSDRQFQVAGQIFTIRKRVKPEVLVDLSAFEKSDDMLTTISDLDRMIKLCLVGPDRERWDAMREDDDDDGEGDIALDEMNDILNMAIEVVMNRPLGSAASSTTGGSPTPTTSVAPSSSRVVATPHVSTQELVSTSPTPT